MASRDYVESLVNGLPPELQPALRDLFTYVLTQLRFGRADAGMPSENFAAAFLAFKTPATPNTTFQVAHGLESTPYLAFPVLALDSVNCVMPQLQVAQVADSAYVYLSSPVASASGILYIEG